MQSRIYRFVYHTHKSFR